MKKRSVEAANLRFALLLTSPVILFLLCFMAYPLGYSAWMSLNNIEYIFGNVNVEFVGLANYTEAFSDRAFWRAFEVSVRFTAESVILTIAIGLGLALVMNSRVGQSRLLRTIIIIPWAVSLYGTGIMWFYLLTGQSGIPTTILSWFGNTTPPNLFSARWVVEVLALGNAWNMAPLVAFFLLAGMQSTPSRLYDLAQIDRLGVWGRFVHVTLPPIRFTLFVFTSIAAIFSFKIFDYINIMSRGGPGDSSTVLTYLIYDISFQQTRIGYGSAVSFLLLALIIVSTLLLYFIWGRNEEPV